MERRDLLKGSAIALGAGIAGCTGGGDGGDGGGDGGDGGGGDGGDGGDMDGGDGGMESTPTERQTYTTQIAAAHYPIVSVYAPMTYAVETGMFEEAGVSIEDITSFGGGGGATVRGIVTGGIGAGFPSLVATVTAYRAGAPIHLVGLNTPTNDIEFIVRDDSDIEEFTPDQLRGKSFAPSAPGSSSEALFIRSIQNTEGITLDDVEIVYAGGYGEVITTLREGSVDIGWSFPPFTFGLYDGEMRQLARARDHAPHITQNTIAMGGPYMDRQPELARRILAVYAEAQDYAENNPAEVGRIWARASDFDEEVGVRVIETVTEGTDFWNISPVEETVRATAQTMIAQGLIDEEPDWSQIIRQDALPEDKRVDWI